METWDGSLEWPVDRVWVGEGWGVRLGGGDAGLSIFSGSLGLLVGLCSCSVGPLDSSLEFEVGRKKGALVWFVCVSVTLWSNDVAKSLLKGNPASLNLTSLDIKIMPSTLRHL